MAWLSASMSPKQAEPPNELPPSNSLSGPEKLENAETDADEEDTAPGSPWRPTKTTTPAHSLRPAVSVQSHRTSLRTLTPAGGPPSTDAQTTSHRGYRMSQTARMLTEKIFAWIKMIGGFRRTRFYGRRRTCAAGLIAATAFNILRIAKLSA